jgi:hypothetical protein
LKFSVENRVIARIPDFPAVGFTGAERRDHAHAGYDDNWPARLVA